MNTGLGTGAPAEGGCRLTNLALGLQYSEPRVVLVTGASGGMGRVLARGFREMGAGIVLADVDGPALAETARLTAGDDRVLALTADLAQVSQALDVVRLAVERFGRLDVVVNNAGLLVRELIPDVTEVSFDTQIGVNLRAPFFVSQAAVKHMTKVGWGRIVNISSIGARTGGITNATAYSAAKAGVISITKSFARTYASNGILVNAVAPGAMDTAMMALPDDLRADVIERTLLGRFADPAEVAEIVFWLASESNSYATGATFDINGGQIMV